MFGLLLFSRSVMSDSVHARLACPSLSPGVCSNSCPLNQWCHPTISSSVAPFSPGPQYFPASGSFPMTWLLASCCQSIGASASVLPMNIQGWFLLGLASLVSLLSKELLRVFQHHSSKTSILGRSAFFVVQLSYRYMTPGETIPFTIWTSIGKVKSLLFNTLS